MQHFHRLPPSMKVTKGLMYVRQRLHRAITVSVTTGTSASPGFKERYGVMTKASGIFDFLSRASVVGITFRVERWYDGSALAKGLWEMQACLAVSVCSRCPCDQTMD